jgi:hypothetical protein
MKIIKHNGVRLRLYADYNAPPRDPDAFSPATVEELSEIVAEAEKGYVTGSTEWGRNAQDADEAGARWAIQLLSEGRKPFIAQDEDGYYFAVKV